MGTQRLSSSSFITIQAVSIARDSQLVYTTSTCNGAKGKGREGMEGEDGEGEKGLKGMGGYWREG